MLDRPLARAALGGRFAQRDVRFAAAGVDFDLVEMKVTCAGQLKPHVSRLGGVKIHGKRLPIRVAVERCSVMLVDQLVVLRIVGEKDHDPRIASGQIATVVEDDSLERRVGTVGRVMPHQEIKIIDAMGETSVWP